MPIVFGPREEYVGAKELKRLDALPGRDVTIDKVTLAKMLDDAFQRGYEAGHYDHGQNTGDIRETRRAEFLDEKPIAQQPSELQLGD